MPEVIVVLGTSVQSDGEPGPRLARRLETAIARLKGRPAVLLLATGGAVGGRPAEALVMREAALAAGIAPERILVEPKARSTWENAAFASVLLAPHPTDRIVLVTDRLHMPRARLAFRAHGFAVTPLPADWPDRRTPRGTALAALCYEALALVWYVAKLARQRLGMGQGN